jgi:hypothetical protein
MHAHAGLFERGGRGTDLVARGAGDRGGARVATAALERVVGCRLGFGWKRCGRTITIAPGAWIDRITPSPSSRRRAPSG